MNAIKLRCVHFALRYERSVNLHGVIMFGNQQMYNSIVLIDINNIV